MRSYTSGKSGLHFDTKYLKRGGVAAINPILRVDANLWGRKGKYDCIPEVRNEPCCFSGARDVL